MFSDWPALPADRKSALVTFVLSLSGMILIGCLAIWAMVKLDAAQLPLTTRSMNAALAAWGLEVENLILVLPLGACMVLFTRAILGIDTFGIYTPMLASLAFIQLGPILGPVIMGGAVIVGMLASPLVDRLHLLRIGFMGVMIGLVVVALVGLQEIIGGGLWVTAFPVVVSALIVERWWTSFEADGWKASARLALATLIVAIVVQFAMVSPPIRWLVQHRPILGPLCAIPLAALIARYQGLRLAELVRFRKTMEDPDERAWHELPQRTDRAG